MRFSADLDGATRCMIIFNTYFQYLNKHGLITWKKISQITVLKDARNKKKGRISTRCHILLYSVTAGELALHNELWISTDAIHWCQFLGLRTMVNAFLRSMRMLTDVLILSLFFISIFALIGTQLFAGALKNKCVSIPNNSTFNFDDSVKNRSMSIVNTRTSKCFKF